MYIYKKQQQTGNHVPPSRQSNEPVTDPNKMAICEFSDQEFKIVVLRKLSGVQDNIEK